jgi:LPXTG-site transpeptidase (sortase) family protein
VFEIERVLVVGWVVAVALCVCGAGAAVALPAPAIAPAARTALRKQMPRPVRIDIPAIGVSARIVPLGLNADRTLEVPANIADAGWFTQGPEPGEQGAAVIAGHLNSRKGPGVFSRLSELRVGGVIRIRLQGGSTIRYVVNSMIRVPKDHFPTRRVYARTTQPTLRLITCAGKLNWATGHHLDNYIVFASIVR